MSTLLVTHQRCDLTGSRLQSYAWFVDTLINGRWTYMRPSEAISHYNRGLLDLEGGTQVWKSVDGGDIFEELPLEKIEDWLKTH